jgi:hypothetical protein
MIYRPQFAFVTPRGFRDEQFHYSFDSTNVAALGSPIAAGQLVENIPLQMQNDAEFILRAVKVQGSGSEREGFTSTAVPNLAIQFKNPYSDFLSATFLPLSTCFTGAGEAVVGRVFVPLESEIICPRSGFLQVNLYNPTAGSLLPPAFTFYGVKRYQECAA